MQMSEMQKDQTMGKDPAGRDSSEKNRHSNGWR